MVMNPAIASAWVSVFAEGTRFLAHRLRHDRETQKAILACTSATELLEIHVNFYQTAIEEYAEEAARLSEMVLQATEVTAEDAVAEHSSESNDLPV